ncbi:tyrosine-type recombinase/integrase [uncultured Sphingomonas sp.]|uniref:tyrosine-type recombinase/integrase n=1 Tax=uncultured Sphingomonas sp. TaxID=158754 RepID=UPI0035CCA461
MVKLTKRFIDTLKPASEQDVMAWDSELRGFGVRVKPSGTISYLIQYRNADGRSCRLTLGKAGTLTPDEARTLARGKLADVTKGADPVAEKRAASGAPTVSEVCDWYLENAKAGRILGRKGRPIKASTLTLDEGRINTHVKPLIGSRRVRTLKMVDLEGFQADIVAGKTAKPRTGPRGGNTTGGPGVAGRTAGMLHTIFAHAKRLNQIEANPAEGQRKFTSPKKAKRRLSLDEIARLGAAMTEAAGDHENATGIGAIRVLLLTGFRRMEGLGLKRPWVHGREGAVYFPDTKSDFQIRAIGRSAVEEIKAQPNRKGSDYVFPADVGAGHFIGVVRVLQRVCKRAKLTGVTPHALRHTFASVAGDLGFSELTIAGLLGHAPRGVTQGYVHLDRALVVAAEQVSAEISRALSAPVPKKMRSAKFQGQMRIAA